MKNQQIDSLVMQRLGGSVIDFKPENQTGSNKLRFLRLLALWMNGSVPKKLLNVCWKMCYATRKYNQSKTKIDYI